MTAQTVRGCTKHVLRFSRRLGDECREASVSALRPRNLSVPSCRPHQRSGSTRRRCPVSGRVGWGAAHAGRWDNRRL